MILQESIGIILLLRKQIVIVLFKCKKVSTLDSICEILQRYFFIQGRLLCVYLVSVMYELSFLANAHSLESHILNSVFFSQRLLSTLPE